MMNYAECIEAARGRIGNYCKACNECNGRACGSQMPGPGSKGVGDTAKRNYDKWKEIRVQMDTISENRPVDTSLHLFGQSFRYQFFAGPVGAVQLHYGDCLNDISYNDILVSSCAEFGIAAFTGDGTDGNVMVAATEAIRKAGGFGIPTVKPWNIETIREKMKMVHESGAFAVAMDVDVSNHGGRVLDQCPATAEVLEDIAHAVDGSMKIFVDGGIRSGIDVFKALALGADAVIIARPFVTAVYGGAREGVKSYIDKIGSELEDTMKMCGVASLEEITRDCVWTPHDHTISF